MKTAGYDFVGEIGEEFLNRAMAAAFYTTTIPHTLEAEYEPENVPLELEEYAKVSCKLHLKYPPTVDFMKEDVVRVLFDIEAFLKVLGSLKLEFDVAASAQCSLTYNQETRILSVDFEAAQFDELTINDKYDLPENVLKIINKAIKATLDSELLENVGRIEIAPILHSAELPDMPPGEELTIGLGNVKILNDRVGAICLNFLGYSGGSIAEMTDFTNGLDFCCGISENAMHRIFDFWWSRTTNPKSGSTSGRCDLPEIIDSILEAIGGIPGIAVKVATLGFGEVEFDVLESWMDYSVAFRITSKPDFDLKPGNVIEVSNLNLSLDAEAVAKVRIKITEEIDTSGFIPDSWTPWEDDITIDEQEVTLPLADISVNDLDVVVDKAIAEVYLDDENRIMAKLKEVHLTIGLGDSWIENLGEVAVNWLIDRIEELIKDGIPPFPLSPSIISTKIPGTSLTLKVDVEGLTTDDFEAVVGANIEFEEIPRFIVPVPRFVANRDPLSLEVHRADCIYVEKIYEKNKVGYYSLMDAIKDGYDGCKYCLPEYHTR
ncbi:hypothetical protein [Archaeoglobus sp.]